MLKFCAGIVAALVLSATSAAAANQIFIGPPSYSEAVYGTPDAPLFWEAPGPYTDITLFGVGTIIGNPQFSFEIRNASPGASVFISLFGGYVGVVGDDGSYSQALTPAGGTIYGNTWFWVSVGHIINPPGYQDRETFDLVELKFTGGRPTPAPEPATWALMIIGFASVGVAMRRRRLAIA